MQKLRRQSGTWPADQEQAVKARKAVKDAIYKTNAKNSVVKALEAEDPRARVGGVGQLVGQVVGKTVTAAMQKYSARAHAKGILNLIKVGADVVNKIAQATKREPLSPEEEQGMASVAGSQVEESIKVMAQGKQQPGQQPAGQQPAPDQAAMQQPGMMQQQPMQQAGPNVEQQGGLLELVSKGGM
jgi:hypothetical protein